MSKLQMFILPYAGGSISSFKMLTNQINKQIDVHTVEYAGRGVRFREPLAGSIEEMLADAAEYINKRRDGEKPYALLGYSMGSLLAYEMQIRKLIQGELIHLFISAEVSPKARAMEQRKIQDPTDERVLERALSLGGLDERMINNKRFSDIYLKPMISDYRIFFQYQFRGYTEKVKADTTFFYCEADTARVDVEQWTELIEGGFDFYEMGENHFFINQHYEEMANVINDHLMRRNN